MANDWRWYKDQCYNIVEIMQRNKKFEKIEIGVVPITKTKFLTIDNKTLFANSWENLYAILDMLGYYRHHGR